MTDSSNVEWWEGKRFLVWREHNVQFSLPICDVCDDDGDVVMASFVKGK